MEYVMLMQIKSLYIYIYIESATQEKYLIQKWQPILELCTEKDDLIRKIVIMMKNRWIKVFWLNSIRILVEIIRILIDNYFGKSKR